MSTARTWLAARAELTMVAALATISAVLIIGSHTMTILGEESPGPAMFPMVVGIFLGAVTIALAVTVITSPRRGAEGHAPDRANFSSDFLHDIGQMEETDDTVHRTGDSRAPARTGRRPLLLSLAALLLFIPLLQVLGWVLSAAALFWVLAQAMGSQQRGMDAFIALFLSSVIQLVFGALLGLNLPAGLIGAL